ncbi:DUF4838 domain-containing protein [Bacteroides pyogenes]|uniref:DUF4838 domain-containing protein n=1 Tax=Bacteroides pyogenes TaxID=310300 RepID=UPI001F398368|nr:DUF4838 domain-containing protein [Bacteroides pyogenes]MCE9107436.1 DUF4838 domain-containing protein [Bacteroides pyogenes]
MATSLFKKYIKICAFILSVLTIGCSAGNADLKAEKYIITAEEDAQSERWAEYLFNHLSKRSSDKSCVTLHKGTPQIKLAGGSKNIHFEVDPELETDYVIIHLSHRLHLRVRDSRTALWMVYQLIDNLAQADKRFDSSDIPPAVIGFKSANKDFSFTYREPFWKPNLDTDYSPLIGTNNVENDWGIWGHTLPQIMKNVDSEEIYALSNGTRNKEQFCFSSPVLFNRLKEYIIDNFGYGEEKGYSFTIMPNDNDIACTCHLCTKLGNTERNASRSVSDLIRKLSTTFPLHSFFTTAYQTTYAPPIEPLPSNAGVLFSTIKLPKGVALEDQPAAEEFTQALSEWGTQTNNVYLWDYAANFDDYLTPLPVLYGLQKQLPFFKEKGIKGVFLNASGYDYSPFDDVKTYVAAALMMDIECDVDSLTASFFKKTYPETHQLLSDYYLSLEKKHEKRGKAYNLYGSIRESIKTYLDIDEFIAFYNELREKLKKAQREEREKLEKLYTALTFTRLQIAYTQGTEKWGYGTKEGNRVLINRETTAWIEDLRKADKYSDLKRYKETGGEISTYIDEWEKMVQAGYYENGLINGSIKILSKPDEGFENPRLLNDGTCGFPQDYHQGWYLSSTDDLAVEISAANIQNMNRIQMRCLQIEKHGIFAPEKIELQIDGKPISVSIDKNVQNSPDSSYSIVTYSLRMNLASAAKVSLKFCRKQVPKSILAIDEIQILNK